MASAIEGKSPSERQDRQEPFSANGLGVDGGFGRWSDRQSAGSDDPPPQLTMADDGGAADRQLLITWSTTCFLCQSSVSDVLTIICAYLAERQEVPSWQIGR